ncbi:uncharacterized protein K452DRAFT_206604, partial [Aplosporella prunicola CBS 121167]
SEILDNVYTGAWTNWSKGAVLGYMLTLERADANPVIALLALFVTFVGTRTWRVSCFALHGILSSEEVQDGLYHQHQAILRNSSNATSGLITLFQLLWAWRSSKPYRRIIPTITLTAIVAMAFAMASCFSSQVATGNEVLISSPRCGSLVYPDGYDNTTVLKTITLPHYKKVMKNAANYAQQCYDPDASGQLQCGTFIKKSLPINITKNAGCPFDDGICRNKNKNLVLDTGYIDSQKDLGINSPPQERFQYRNVLHCSPLVTRGYKAARNSSSGSTYTRYYYGKTSRANYTYEYKIDPIWESANVDFVVNNISPDYDISTYSAHNQNGSFSSYESNFHPIPDLQRSDADVTLIFLSAGKVTFSTKTVDDWYSATHIVARGISMYGSGNGTLSNIYGQDEPASPLACASQVQWCNSNLPENNRCTPLSGQADAFYSAQGFFKNEALKERLNWFWDFQPQLDALLSYLGSQSLKSTNSLSGGTQGPLPDNQWQLDVQNWFATMLAYMQAYAVSIVTGPSDVNLQQYVVQPNSTTERSICKNQIIVSSVHYSFSLFGIYFILVLGCLIILISYILGPVFNMLHKRYHLKGYALLEWCTNDTLQLQRLAHEELGFGTWSYTTDAIPVPKCGEPLAVLDLKDPKHPKL